MFSLDIFYVKSPKMTGNALLAGVKKSQTSSVYKAMFSDSYKLFIRISGGL